MIFIHNHQEIVDIQFRSGIYDCLDLIQQLCKLNSLWKGDLVQRHLTVDA